MNDLKRRVARSDYAIDCGAVAEAFLAAHNRCWYPVSRRSPAASEVDRPGGPSMMRPITRIDADGGG